MVGWSFPVGRIFGVEVRLHSFFLLLLVLSVTWSSTLGLSAARGMMLWLLLLLAVVVREIARALAAAWFALDVRSIVLLPTGGLLTYSSPDSLARASSPRIQKRMALVGPVVSLSFGVVLAAIVLAVAPGVDLYTMRWVTPAHLVRTMVWVNLMLGALNFLPAWPLDAGRVVRSEITRPVEQAEKGTAGGGAVADGGKAKSTLARWSLLQTAAGPSSLRAISTMGPAIALVLIVLGLITVNWWLIMAGIGILIGAQIERQGLLLRTDLDKVLVRDVMLTDYSVISASSTLEDALEHARHSLQDVFPVVRGGSLVGAIGRHTILANMEATGNSYVQGLMTRSFPTAAPGEPLVQALGRITGPNSQAAQLVPVVVGETIVGIITPQNLQRSMSILPNKAAAAVSDRT